MIEEYKFQKLQLYKLALAYVDVVYEMSRSANRDTGFLRSCPPSATHFDKV